MPFVSQGPQLHHMDKRQRCSPDRRVTDVIVEAFSEAPRKLKASYKHAREAQVQTATVYMTKYEKART